MFWLLSQKGKREQKKSYRQLNKGKLNYCMEKDSKFDNLITCAANPSTSTVLLNAILKQAWGKDERADISPKIQEV